MIRVSVVSHTYVAAVNHQKLEAIAALPGVALQVIAPESWPEREMRRRLALGRRSDPRYEIVGLPILFAHPAVYLFSPAGLWRALRRFRADILHIELEPWSLAALQAAVMGRLLGQRIVFFTWENLRRRYPLPLAAVRRLVFGLADAAIAGNREGAEVLRGAGFRRPTFVLPQLGVDPQTFRPAVDREAVRRDLGLDGFVVGYAGRLSAAKGIGVLLEAVRGLDRGFTLLAVGSGPMDAEVEAAARRGEGARVRLVRAVPHEEIPRYLNALDVLVLPSLTTPAWKEQFGHVLIEAMACGVPVIGSDSGAIPDVAGDAGLVVPEGQAAALRDAILRVAADASLRETLGRHGRARVLDRYTHGRIAEATQGIYHDLIPGVTGIDVA